MLGLFWILLQSEMLTGCYINILIKKKLQYCFNWQVVQTFSTALGTSFMTFTSFSCIFLQNLCFFIIFSDWHVFKQIITFKTHLPLFIFLFSRLFKKKSQFVLIFTFLLYRSAAGDHRRRLELHMRLWWHKCVPTVVCTKSNMWQKWME